MRPELSIQFCLLIDPRTPRGNPHLFACDAFSSSSSLMTVDSPQSQSQEGRQTVPLAQADQDSILRTQFRVGIPLMLLLEEFFSRALLSIEIESFKSSIASPSCWRSRIGVFFTFKNENSAARQDNLALFSGESSGTLSSISNLSGKSAICAVEVTLLGSGVLADFNGECVENKCVVRFCSELANLALTALAYDCIAGHYYFSEAICDSYVASSNSLWTR